MPPCERGSSAGGSRGTTRELEPVCEARLQCRGRTAYEDGYGGGLARESDDAAEAERSIRGVVLNEAVALQRVGHRGRVDNQGRLPPVERLDLAADAVKHAPCTVHASCHQQRSSSQPVLKPAVKYSTATAINGRGDVPFQQ